MIHWTAEGQTLRNGLSFYKPSDAGSIGFTLRIGNHAWLFRYSKRVKKLFAGHVKRGPQPDWVNNENPAD